MPFTQPHFPQERIKVATLDARTSSVFDHRHMSRPGFDFGRTGRRPGLSVFDDEPEAKSNVRS